MNLSKNFAEELQWGDPEELEVAEGAWNLVKDSGINILRDKELMMVLFQGEDGEAMASPQDVVGALFGSWEARGMVFSFDLIVAKDFQGHGVGQRLFRAGLTEGRSGGAKKVALEAVHLAVVKMAATAGFEHKGGRVYELVLN